MKKTHTKNDVKIQGKRNVELWIYSFADMYMILSVFFIALSVLYAAQVKKELERPPALTSAGRGPSSVVSELELSFPQGSAELTTKNIEELQLLLPAVKAMGKGFVDVEGYADNVPLKKDSEFSSNLDLSNRRAVRVSEWLMKNGVPSKKVRTYSYGSGQSWSKKVVKSNRRVVVKLAL